MRALARRWLPRRTVRLRLTLLYGALFLVAGAALLGITYGLVAQETGESKLTIQSGVKDGGKVGATRVVRIGTDVPPPDALLPPDAAKNVRFAQKVAGATRAQQLRSLLTWSAIALGIMAVVSVALGWLMAGRALRPLRTMTAAARHISEENLHERLALAGPDDELKELGDTIDGLLARLQGAFEAQRRFVANASHELRTPLTLERAMIEVALADPHADADSLRAVCERVLVAGAEQERVIEALLTLARSQRGLEERQPFDLAAVVEAALADLHAELRIDATLETAATTCDRRLVERLVVNLLDNAVRHNVPGGWVRVRTGVQGERAMLGVENSGRMVPPDEVEGLLEPFRRAAPARSTHGDGLGLGLSIAAAIATAHDSTLAVRARADGGLEVEVALPFAGTGALTSRARSSAGLSGSRA
jgi:signal transduction histidine kinase